MNLNAYHIIGIEGRRRSLKRALTPILIYNAGVSNESGHAVDAFRILNPEKLQHGGVTVQVDIAIRDTDAE